MMSSVTNNMKLIPSQYQIHWMITSTTRLTSGEVALLHLHILQWKRRKKFQESFLRPQWTPLATVMRAISISHELVCHLSKICIPRSVFSISFQLTGELELELPEKMSLSGGQTVEEKAPLWILRWLTRTALWFRQLFSENRLPRSTAQWSVRTKCTSSRMDRSSLPTKSSLQSRTTTVSHLIRTQTSQRPRKIIRSRNRGSRSSG